MTSSFQNITELNPILNGFEEAEKLVLHILDIFQENIQHISASSDVDNFLLDN